MLKPEVTIPPPTPPDETDYHVAGLLASVIVACAVLIALVAALGCSRAPAPTLPKGTPAVPVAIVAWPAPIKPTCKIEREREVPKLSVYTADGQAGGVMYYVTFGELSKYVEHLKDAALVRAQIVDCLSRLADLQ